MSRRISGRREIADADMSADQQRCLGALAWCVGGRHHIYNRVYECGYGIRTTLNGEASTYDGDLMTRFVMAAHRWAVRFTICNGGPHRMGVECHARKPDGDSLYVRHPRLEDLIAACVQLSNYDHAEAEGGAK